MAPGIRVKPSLIPNELKKCWSVEPFRREERPRRKGSAEADRRRIVLR